MHIYSTVESCVKVFSQVSNTSLKTAHAHMSVHMHLLVNLSREQLIDNYVPFLVRQHLQHACHTGQSDSAVSYDQ